MVQTKTKKNPEQSTLAHDRLSAEHANWASAADQVTAFTYDRDFITYCEQNGASPEDQTTFHYACALDSYVTDYAKVHEADGTLTQDEADRLRVVAGYPAHSYKTAFVDACNGITLNKEDRKYYYDCKENLAAYNHVASDYINRHSHELALNDIASSIVAATGQMSPDSLSKMQLDLIRVLRGARTEAINQRLIDRLKHMLPGVIDGRPATIAEDLAGIDYVAKLAGQPLYLDFKSSLMALLKGDAPSREALADGFKIRTSKRDATKHIAIMTPTFDEASLGDACQLSAVAEGAAAMALANNLGKIAKATS